MVPIENLTTTEVDQEISRIRLRLRYFRLPSQFESRLPNPRYFVSNLRSSLRISLLLAGTACILRPTNGLIWFCILMPAITGIFSSRASLSSYLILLREAVLCGSTALLVSAISDRYYFGEWTFPPYQWFHFNISQDLAVFYGRNDWHYYLSQGLPLLLTAYVPFTLAAFYQATSLPASNIRFILTTTIFVTIATLSLISHKEVRFIYPLLPLLHIVTAPTISSFFQPTTVTNPSPKSKSPPKSSIHHKTLLCTILLLNLTIASYTTLVHQRGVLTILPFLRSEYESLALDNRGRPLDSPLANTNSPIPKHTDYSASETFIAFLMPCHSTPWRSQLIHPGLKAWALTCEPPIHLAQDSKARAEYRDEADRFYDDPKTFLDTEVGGRERPWPRYIAGFEGIENDLKEWYEGRHKGWRMQERWRGGNSQWHDDSRRTGDVVVWEFVEGSKA
jgi:phosphatidylinositol glycan class B